MNNFFFNEIDFMSRNLIHKNHLPETFVKNILKNLITSIENLNMLITIIID
jgi:hypothetical protein